MTRPIARKKDTGEAGNPGQFGSTGRGEAEVAFAPSDEDLVERREDGSVRFGKYETLDAKIEAMRGEIDSAFDSLEDDQQWQSFLDTMSRFHRYSPTNQMLIHLQSGGKATRVAGFKVWKSLGRSVRKGERGMAIFAPVTRRVTEEDDNGDEKTSKRVVGWTTAAVFDVSQTDGEDLPEYDHDALSAEVPEGFQVDLEQAIADAGFQVKHEETGSAALGYTSPSGVVVIDPRLEPAARVQCLAHELAHIKAGHLERIGEYSTVHGARGEMEVEADSIAYVLCRSAGMKSELPERTAKYLYSWSGGDKEVLRRGAERISKISKELLSSGAFRDRDNTAKEAA